MLCSMTAGLTTLWSCDDNEPGNNDPEVEITLQSPANNVAINLSEVGSTAFKWTKAERVTAYTLKFSPTETELAGTSVKIDAGNVAEYNLDSQAADVMLAGNTSLQPGESTDMFWTVVPTTAVPNVKTQVRKFRITRLPVAVTPTLSISTESLVFAANPSAAQTVTITANIGWQVSITPAGGWLTANPIAGSGNGSIEFTAADNTGAERTAVITISGTGVESKTVNVTQAAKGAGGTEAPVGAWNLKIYELNSVVGLDGKEYRVSVTQKYITPLSLNDDGSFTGELTDVGPDEQSRDGSGVKTWNYDGDSISWNNSGSIFKCKATVTSSELTLEYGIPNVGNYKKATYSREPVAVPPIPEQVTELYTGDASALLGDWVLAKQENNFSSVTENNPAWSAMSFNPNEEAGKLTVNSDGTYRMAHDIFGDTDYGTWSYADGMLTSINRYGQQTIQNVETGTSASTLIWSTIDTERIDGTVSLVYQRMTWVRKP
jgi:hypothetical protein